MTRLNTKPLSGTRDFLPVEVLRRKYVLEIIESVYQGYGFEPLETPAMERLETLLGKYGEEGDQLIFRVLKRGEKLDRALADSLSEQDLADAGLRYDLTVPLARIAAEYETQLPRIFKRYQIQPVFRADRPAKGRFREFFQCDLDIVGSHSPIVETEVLNAAAEVLIRLGFQPAQDFRIRLNHRCLLRAIISQTGVGPQLEETALVAIDKLDKIGSDGVREELGKRDLPPSAVERLMSMLEAAPAENEQSLEWLRSVLRNSQEGTQAMEELANLLAYSRSGPAADCLRIDPFLARGLSYYTGPIFEVQIGGSSGSAGGGGRYDNLIGMFSGRKVPACGFSLGLERLLLILEERQMFPERLAGQPQVLITQFDATTVLESLRCAQQLRDAGIRVDVYPETGKYGKQFKYAEQRGIRFALLLGPRELQKGTVIAKDLQSGEQSEMTTPECGAWFRSVLGTS